MILPLIEAGKYTYVLKRRTPLSSLAKDDPSFEAVVGAMMDLESCCQKVKLAVDDDALEVSVNLSPIKNMIARQELDTLLATLSSLHLPEIITFGGVWAEIYRLRPPPLHLVGRDNSKDYSPLPSGLQVFQYSDIYGVDTRRWAIDSYLDSISRCETLVTYCLGLGPGGCVFRCSCWDDGVTEPASLFNETDEDKRHRKILLAEVVGLLKARKERQKAIHLIVLRMMTSAYLLRPSSRSGSSLPPEIADMILDLAGESLSPTQLVRAKSLAFDRGHLSLRTQALRGMEGEQFSAALEEWLVDEGFVYIPPPPPPAEAEDAGGSHGSGS